MAGKSAARAIRSALPVEGAFVVHFGVTRRGRVRFTGRVEHLASGSAAHFGSLRELLAFVRLASPKPQLSERSSS